MVLLLLQPRPAANHTAAHHMNQKALSITTMLSVSHDGFLASPVQMFCVIHVRMSIQMLDAVVVFKILTVFFFFFLGENAKVIVICLTYLKKDMLFIYFLKLFFKYLLCPLSDIGWPLLPSAACLGMHSSPW